MMRVRFQRDVRDLTPSTTARLRKCNRLSVLYLLVNVVALAEDFPAT
jgi:hypothetical protein